MVVHKKERALSPDRPNQNQIQDEVYHQSCDTVKPEFEKNEDEAELDKKAEELHRIVKSLNSTQFAVRVPYLCKKYDISTTTLKQIRKEILSENERGEDRRASRLIENTVPFENPVLLRDALDLIYSTLKRYIAGDESLLVRATLWVAHTYFLDALSISPLALITSPQSNCGKSMLMTVMMDMTYRSLPASASMSEATMFRIIEECCPTIGLDEADLNLGNRSELQAILNAGHMRKTAYTYRCEPNSNVVEAFSTFCPKIVVGIRSVQIRETLTNRSIVFSMRRKTRFDQVETYQQLEAESACADIRSKTLRAAQDAIRNGSFDMYKPIDWPEWLDDGRNRDNWSPLLHIAMAASDEWYQRAIDASENQDIDNLHIDYDKQLLIDLCEIICESEKSHFTVHDLLRELLAINSDWANANYGQCITWRWLSNRLSSYGLKSNRIRQNGKQIRCYERAELLQAFKNYVDVEQIVKSLNEMEDEVVEDDREKYEHETISQLAKDIVQVASSSDKTFMTPKELTEQLSSKPHWQFIRGSEPMTVRWLAMRLAILGVKSCRVSLDKKQVRAYDVKVLRQIADQGRFSLAEDNVQAPSTQTTLKAELKEDLKTIINSIDDEAITPQFLVEQLLKTNAKWLEANNGVAIDKVWLSNHLASLGIYSTKIRGFKDEDGNTIEFYLAEEFL